MKDRIKKLRKTLEMSQAEFGKELGTRDSIVTRWESGAAPVPTSRVLQICQTFNVNRAWLESGVGEMFAPAPSPLTDDDAFVQTAFALIKSLPEDKQKIFVDLARRLLIDGEDPAAYARRLLEERKARDATGATTQMIVNNNGVVASNFRTGSFLFGNDAGKEA